MTLGLRKHLFCGKIWKVRRSVIFLQNGTSARLAAPLICMPAPEPFPAQSGQGKHVGRHEPGGKKSSPRPLPLDRNPDGMEQKPYESQPETAAEDHRVRRRSNRPGPGFT